MSFEFSRRSFLKYTAVAAVAVAGSSLLSGCKDDAYQPTGKIGSTLSLMGDFKMKNAKLANAPADVAAENILTCDFDLKCTSKYGLNIIPANFQVEVTSKATKKVTTYHAYNTDGTGKISLSNSNNYLSKDDSLNTTLKIENISLADGDTIKVKFWPRPQASEGSQAYTRAYCTWSMTVDKTVTTGNNSFLK